MKRSGMPRPTSCKVSPDTKLFKDNNVYEDTEPPPGTNILLPPVPSFPVSFVVKNYIDVLIVVW